MSSKDEQKARSLLRSYDYPPIEDDQVPEQLLAPQHSFSGLNESPAVESPKQVSQQADLLPIATPEILWRSLMLEQ